MCVVRVAGGVAKRNRVAAADVLVYKAISTVSVCLSVLLCPLTRDGWKVVENEQGKKGQTGKSVLTVGIGLGEPEKCSARPPRRHCEAFLVVSADERCFSLSRAMVGGRSAKNRPIV